MKTALLSLGATALFGALFAQSGSMTLSTRPVGWLSHYPDPADFVVVREGAPFVVPADRVFVATGVGSAGNRGSYSLAIDSRVVATGIYIDLMNSGIIAQLPPGMVADEGSTVECVLAFGGPSLGDGRAWGFLVSKDSNGRTPPTLLEHPPVSTSRVAIHEGESFVVPSDKLFVLTGIGTVAGWPNHSVRINGTIEVSGGSKHWHGASVIDVPPGLAVAGGATIEVVDVPNDPRDFGEGIALGYLRDL